MFLSRRAQNYVTVIKQVGGVATERLLFPSEQQQRWMAGYICLEHCLTRGNKDGLFH